MFAFKISHKEPPTPPEGIREMLSVSTPAPAKSDYLEKKIDEMLFALLDLKKYIALQQA